MKYPTIFWILTVWTILNNVACQQNTSQRKIQLSNTPRTVTRNEDQLTTTIHLEPSQQRSVAVMFFKNRTGDQNLEWLQKGLAEMFIRALSQSHHLSVLGTDRLIEILDRLDQDLNQKVDMDMAAVVAKEANVEVLLRGNIYRHGQSLQLNVQLVEPYDGLVLREESVEGSGLETILTMVDHISQKIQQDLQFPPDKDDTYRGIAELSTHSMEAWQQYTLAEELHNQLRIQEAIPHYKKAIELDSTFVSPYLKLFRCVLSQGDNETAFALYQMAEKLKDNATRQEQYQLELTRALYNTDIERLLNLQIEWIKKNPTDIRAHHDLADIYFGLRNYDKAIEYYEKIRKLDSKYKLTLNSLGYCYALTGDYHKAEAILNEYRQTVPDEPNPYDSLGEIYLFQGEYKKAARYFRMALEKTSEFTAAYDHLANAAIEAGDYTKAMIYFEKSLDHHAEGAQKSKALSDIAGLYQRTGKTEKSLSTYREALEEYPFQFNPALEMVEIYEMKGDTSRAIDILKNQYHQIRKTLTTDRKKRDHFPDLASISIWHHIEPENSLRLIDSTLAVIDNPFEMFWAKFLKMLLLIQMDRTDEIDPDWQNNLETQFLAVMQNVNNIGYSNMWRLFHILNDMLVEMPLIGIVTYQHIIESSAQCNLNFYETGFRGLLADLYIRTGNHSGAFEQVRMAGTPLDSLWFVMGPFENRNGFNRRFPPEKKLDLSRTYQQSGQLIRWKRLDDGYFDGYIDLKHQFTKSDWAVAYGVIHIESPEEKEVQFRTGSDEAIKIWLNGEEVWRLNRIQDAIIDDQITPVTLQPGINLVLIKICNRYRDWGFYFRVTDAQGKGIQDIRFLPVNEVCQEIS